MNKTKSVHPIWRSVVLVFVMTFILNIPDASGHSYTAAYYRGTTAQYSNTDWMASLPNILQISDPSFIAFTSNNLAPTVNIDQIADGEEFILTNLAYSFSWYSTNPKHLALKPMNKNTRSMGLDFGDHDYVTIQNRVLT